MFALSHNKCTIQRNNISSSTQAVREQSDRTGKTILIVSGGCLTLFAMPSIYIYSHLTGFFKGTDALIYVVDSSDIRRMKETGDELTQLLKEEKLEGVPLLVFANKQDLLNALSADEIRDGLELDRIQQRKWTIQSCSSKSGEGLDDGFQWVMANMRQK